MAIDLAVPNQLAALPFCTKIFIVIQARTILFFAHLLTLIPRHFIPSVTSRQPKPIDICQH